MTESNDLEKPQKMDNVLEELEAMKKVAEALSPLSEGARERIIRWATELYCRQNIKISSEEKEREPVEERGSREPEQSVTVPPSSPSHIDDLPSLFSMASPRTDIERALIVSYWRQVKQDQPDVDAYTINSELRHLGHPISNITRAFGSLMTRKPQLVMQVKKSGNSKQSRKRYKLTIAGIQKAEQMIEEAANM